MSTPFDLSSQSYNIYNELKARKILEKYTDYHYTFEKNSDKYGFDLLVFRYTDIENNFRKNHLGYIEVECAVNWRNFHFPNNWYCVSFLKRKFYDFDFTKRVWINYKKDVDKTIYLKFNHPMNNCFCKEMMYIIQYGKDSARNKKNDYFNSFIELDINQVCWGIDRCIYYITDFFINIENSKNNDVRYETEELEMELL